MSTDDLLALFRKVEVKNAQRSRDYLAAITALDEKYEANTEDYYVSRGVLQARICGPDYHGTDTQVLRRIHKAMEEA